uniref:Putative secreted protein n=1 Tax=Anopheles marajoara TaxID=58244 RepID=A0A2M4CEA6_9DIPT
MLLTLLVLARVQSRSVQKDSAATVHSTVLLDRRFNTFPRTSTTILNTPCDRISLFIIVVIRDDDCSSVIALIRR